MAHAPAPDELELVRSFVNTYDVEDDVDELADAGALAAWLREAGMLDGSGASPADHRHAIELRGALRAVLLHHGGLELDPRAPEIMEAAARRAQLSVRFDGHGRVSMEPLARGVDGALGRLLAIVAAAEQHGTWQRLKACAADDCQWAFYDRSRNRSAVWCSMEVCGNRAKVRSWRERQASQR